MFPKPVQKLIDEFSSLPGVGYKSATRMVLYLLDAPESVSESLASYIKDLKQTVHRCSVCYNFSEDDQCKICSAKNRQKASIMVVETPLDILAFEESNYQGVYHVLGGLISPLQGIGPDEILIKELIDRLKRNLEEEKELEIIFACSTSLEGESTVTYIRNLIDKINSKNKIKMSRIGRGLPTNSAIEYQDPQTLFSAFQNRITI